MIYNYYIRTFDGQRGAKIAATNDLVLAKEYMFNLCIDMFEHNSKLSNVVKYKYYERWNEETRGNDWKLYNSRCIGGEELIAALENGEMKEDELLNNILPLIHETIEIGHWIWCKAEIKKVPTECQFSDRFVPIDRETTHHEYLENKRKYNFPLSFVLDD